MAGPERNSMMPQVIAPLISIGQRLINTGDRWTRQGVKLVSLLVVLWFVPLIALALTPLQLIQDVPVLYDVLSAARGLILAALVIMPFTAVVIGLLLLVHNYPLISHAVAMTGRAKDGMRKIALILGAQISIGLFFMVVPTYNDPWWTTVIIFAGLAFALLKLSGVHVKAVPTLLLALILVGTAILMFGGRTALTDRVRAEAKPVEEKIGDYPECAVAEDHRITDHEDVVTIRAHADCWSGWVTTPPGSTYLITPEPDTTIDILFWDNTVVRDGPGQEPTWLGVKRGVFRVAGVGENTDVTITIERK